MICPITSKMLNTIEIKNQPPFRKADGYIANAIFCNGLLQHHAIIQAAYAVPEGLGLDKPPVARREVVRNGQGGNAGRGYKEYDQFVNEPVKRETAQEFHAFLIAYFRKEYGGRSGGVFLADKIDKRITGEQAS